MMKYIKIVLTIICIYVFIINLHITIAQLLKHYSEIEVLLAELVIIGSCIVLPLLVWKRTIKISSIKLFWGVVLLIPSIVIKMLITLFMYLMKEEGANKLKEIWVTDLPNLLSVVVMVILLGIMVKRRRN